LSLARGVDNMSFARPEVNEFGVQCRELMEIGGTCRISAFGALETGGQVGSQYCVVDQHIAAAADLGYTICAVRKHRAVENHGVSAEGELGSGGRYGCSHHFVPVGTLKRCGIREGIVEEAEKRVRGNVDTRVETLYEQSADGRLAEI